MICITYDAQIRIVIFFINIYFSEFESWFMKSLTCASINCGTILFIFIYDIVFKSLGLNRKSSWVIYWLMCIIFMVIGRVKSCCILIFILQKHVWLLSSTCKMTDVTLAFCGIAWLIGVAHPKLIRTAWILKCAKPTYYFSASSRFELRISLSSYSGHG